MSRPRPLLAASAVALLLSVACATPPDKELHQAEGSLGTARAAGAERYAPQEFAAAASALAKARAAVDEHDYKQALNYALDARDRADTAVRTASDARATARVRLVERLDQLDEECKTLDTRIVVARAANVPVRAISAAEAASGQAASSLRDVRPRLERGQDEEATRAMAAVALLLTGARSEIDAAIDAQPARTKTVRKRR